jgi:hypothetical protein
MKHVYVSRAVCCVLALAMLTVIAVTIPASAAAGNLSEKQVASLSALGVHVALPTYIPPGYALEEVRITPCIRGHMHTKCASHGDYIVRYHNGSAWFSIEETAGDLAETKLTYKTFVKTQIFGTVPLRFGAGGDGIGLAPGPAQLHGIQNELYTDWLGSGPYYHLIGERIAPAVMARILGSVEWLPRND